jgi:hypothetical protein
MAFIKEIEKYALKLIWECRRPKIDKAMLCKTAKLKVSQCPTLNYTTEP